MRRAYTAAFARTTLGTTGAVDDRVCGGDFEQTLNELEDTSAGSLGVAFLKRSARSRRC